MMPIYVLTTDNKKTLNKMDERAEQTDREVPDLLNKMDERAEQRHQEVIEICKRRFSGCQA